MGIDTADPATPEGGDPLDQIADLLMPGDAGCVEPTEALQDLGALNAPPRAATSWTASPFRPPR